MLPSNGAAPTPRNTSAWQTSRAGGSKRPGAKKGAGESFASGTTRISPEQPAEGDRRVRGKQYRCAIQHWGLALKSGKITSTLIYEGRAIPDKAI